MLFLDSDDWVDPNFLAKMNAALDEDPSAVASYCDHCRAGGGAAGLKNNLLDIPRMKITGDCTLEDFVNCLEAYQ